MQKQIAVNHRAFTTVSITLMSVDGEEFFYPSGHQFKEAGTEQYQLGMKAALSRGCIIVTRDTTQHAINVEGNLNKAQLRKLKREAERLNWRLERRCFPTVRKPAGMEMLYQPHAMLLLMTLENLAGELLEGLI